MEGDIESIVRSAPGRAPLEAWALILASQNIPHRIVRRDRADDGALPPEGTPPFDFALVVQAGDATRADAALAQVDAEDAERARTPEVPPPDHGRPIVPLLVCIALGAFFLLTGPRRGGSQWFALGSAQAEAIAAGAWWRAITGMCLHADAMHLFGNLVAMLVFLSAVARWVGGGLALALMILAGFLGNLTTALVYGTHHDSVGASTATFAALGLLGALQARHRVRHGWWHRSRRLGRAYPAVAACLALFAMLGVGTDTSVDVMAHVTGLAWGLVVGLVAATFPARLSHRLSSIACGTLGAGAVAGSWWLALRAVA